MEEKNNQTQYFNEVENQQQERPLGLSIFCVLSFVGSGSIAFFLGIYYFMYDFIKSIYEDDERLELLGRSEAQIAEDMAMLSINKIYILLASLLAIGSFIGVSYMWKLKKNGFHIYAISNILMLIIEYFVCRAYGGTILDSIIITIVFIGVYYYYYKKKVLQ